MGGGAELSPRYLAKKLSHECTRCSRDAEPHALMCARHREQHAAIERMRQEIKRRQRRARGQCIGCGVESEGYRCEGCEVARKVGGRLVWG